MKVTQREFVSNFMKTLSYEGDIFISSGSVRQDYHNIRNTVEAQGYWSGVVARYYFDEDFNLIKTEGRTFGR